MTSAVPQCNLVLFALPFQQLNWELLVGVMFGTVILYHSLVNAAAHDRFVMK